MLVEIIGFFLTPFVSLFGPYVNRATDTLTSPKTQRTAVKSIFITGAAVVLVSIAFIAYLGFYMIYVPKIAHVKPIYLQYRKEGYPYAVVDFTENDRYDSFLTADQAYVVSIDLDVPSSDRNVGLGNFMIGLELKARNETVQSSSRPCILTYQSNLFRFVYTFWRLVPLVLGFTKEDQRLRITMLESMIESAGKPITQALITISTVSNNNLEVYSAQIRLDAHFQGLRYFMYYHPIPTAITFMTMFLSWEILFSVFAWKSFVSWWQNKITSPEKPQIVSETNNITDDNLRDDDSDKTWLDGRRNDMEENLDDDGTTAESESEYEPSRPGSVISPTETALVSESGETSYTESYVTDDDSIISQPLDDDDSSILNETDEDDDQTEGSATPTTRSRRSTVSEISTNRSEFEDRPTATSTSRLQSGGSTSAYTRRTSSSGGNNE